MYSRIAPITLRDKRRLAYANYFVGPDLGKPVGIVPEGDAEDFQPVAAPVRCFDNGAERFPPISSVDLGYADNAKLFAGFAEASGKVVDVKTKRANIFDFEGPPSHKWLRNEPTK
jgi:hypothetical protein